MSLDSVGYTHQLQAKYQKEAPVPPAGVVVPDAFRYIHFKAFAFLTAGPDEYRKHENVVCRKKSQNLNSNRHD